MNARENKWFWVGVAALTLAGCSDLGAPLKLLPHIELSAVSLDFGTVVVSGSATRSVVIGNSGNAPINGIAAVACTGYSIDSGGGAFAVPPAGQHTVVVRYEPSDVGSSPCELTLGNGLPSVRLSGSGALQAAGAVCTVSVPSLDFGLVSIPGSKPGQFKLFSAGTAPVILNVVASCGAFGVLSGGGPRTLAPGDSLAVTLSFAPAVGGHTACTIATGPGCPDVAVTGDATSVSFAADIRPIFVSDHCVSCHIYWQASDLVDVPAGVYAPAVYIKPFDAPHSVLYGKVTGNRTYGNRMPELFPPLTSTKINLIRTWIVEGAHDN